MGNHQNHLCLFILEAFFLFSTISFASNSDYNVQDFGAKGDGVMNSTMAFLSAWAVACASTASATIYVPTGRYLLGYTKFPGYSCKSNAITLKIDGTLVAPADYNVLGKSGNWISFERVNGLTILGGILDGQGTGLWECKNNGNKKCPSGAATLAIYNSMNVFVSGLSSLNSQQFHIILDGCTNSRLDGIQVSADGNSPNTDGIHVMSSSGISITNSNIATGDDCISIGPGTSYLWIQNIACGPGHGISIGSLGSNVQEPGVQNVTVNTVTFTNTQNGFRVKTWARPSNGFVTGVVFQHARMNNVKNPIIIDQYYCPNGNGCSNKDSGIKISDVTYQDVQGTSATQVAVKLDCSKQNPCTKITLREVNLSYKNETATASCNNAGGNTYGIIQPNGCL